MRLCSIVNEALERQAVKDYFNVNIPPVHDASALGSVLTHNDSIKDSDASSLPSTGVHGSESEKDSGRARCTPVSAEPTGNVPRGTFPFRCYKHLVDGLLQRPVGVPSWRSYVSRQCDSFDVLTMVS